MTTQFISLISIQTIKSYKLIKINCISFYKKFIYRNIYIYNLVKYFLEHIYYHSTISTSINNIILLFNHYL